MKLILAIPDNTMTLALAASHSGLEQQQVEVRLKAFKV